MEIKFFEYEAKQGEEIYDLWKANQEADLSHLPTKLSYFKGIVIGCSDARCEEDAVIPGLYVITTAGNKVELDQIPEGLARKIIIVGHEKEEGSGCGACGLAAKVESDPSVAEGIPPQLAAIGKNCTGDTKKNLLESADELKKAGYEVALLMFNHVTGDLVHLGDIESYTPVMKELVETSLERHAKEFKPTYKGETERGDMSKGQNPYVIACVLGPLPTLSDMTGKDSKYNGPNCVYEVRPGKASLTEFAQGSLQYPWLHALGLDENNFQETTSTVFAVHRSEDLEAAAETLKEDNALEIYLKQGGRVFGAVVGEGYKFVKLYELKKTE